MMAASSIFGRRQVMQAAATFVVSAASKTAFADDFGYVDAHSHLWSIDRVDYPLAPGAKEEDVQPKSFDVGEFSRWRAPKG